MDALIVSHQRKTLSGLARLRHRAVDPKALADFFRESPRTVALSGQPRKKFMLLKLLELAQKAGFPLKIVASVDDSLGKKGKTTRHLEAVDYHHNSTSNASTATTKRSSTGLTRK
ncbi:MAG: hypothetical protein ACP5QU_08715 [Anaerolineae bacterium]